MRRKTLPCTEEEEEEALRYCITISNLSFTHYPIQPLWFSFPNFMAAHGVGVAQAKPGCKHTIATRKCYQYNKQLNRVPIYNVIFMSGAHGVAGWVWGGDSWVSVDRRLFHVVASGLGGFGAVVFGNTAEIGARGFP